MKFDHISGVDIHILIDDIVHQECDAIVNAANIYLQNGSGVCGAIFNGAGPQLKEACDEKLRILGRNLHPGESVVTPGYNIKAKYILHSVSPRCMFRWDEKIEETMRVTYRNIFDIAECSGFNTIAIPAMGVGHHHCDVDKCTSIAINELIAYINRPNHTIQEIRFVLSDESIQARYIKSLISILQMEVSNATSGRV
jgi:O-acetyl-ADP-ribose deacetylase (regulator of RNase III)